MGGGPIGPSRGAPGGKRHSTKLKGVGLGLVFLCAIPGIAQVAAAEAPQGPSICDKFASPSGSDGGTGTLVDPYATPKKLIDSLDPGQSGCFRAGTYTFSELAVNEANITLSPYGSEAVTLRGPIKVRPSGHHSTIEGMKLDGRGGAS